MNKKMIHINRMCKTILAQPHRRIRFRKLLTEIEKDREHQNKLQDKGVNTRNIRKITINFMFESFKEYQEQAKNPDIPVKFQVEYARMAAYCAQVMMGYLNDIDEDETDEKLKQIEAMLNELETSKKNGGTASAVGTTKPT